MSTRQASATAAATTAAAVGRRIQPPRVGGQTAAIAPAPTPAPAPATKRKRVARAPATRSSLDEEADESDGSEAESAGSRGVARRTSNRSRAPTSKQTPTQVKVARGKPTPMARRPRATKRDVSESDDESDSDAAPAPKRARRSNSAAGVRTRRIQPSKKASVKSKDGKGKSRPGESDQSDDSADSDSDSRSTDESESDQEDPESEAEESEEEAQKPSTSTRRRNSGKGGMTQKVPAKRKTKRPSRESEDEWDPKQGMSDAAGSESDSDADEVKVAPVQMTLMETLLSPGAYPALQAAAIALALNNPMFDVNQLHPVTGDSLMQVLYSVFTCASRASRELRPLSQHIKRILELVKQADFSHRNAKGETILHTIVSDVTYSHEIPLNMRSRWARRHYQKKAEANEAAGLAAPPLFETRVAKANAKFANAVFNRCLKLGMNWMEPTADGQVPLLQFTRLVKRGMFKCSEGYRLLSARSVRDTLDLSVVDDKLNSPLHLLFDHPNGQLYDTSPSILGFGRALMDPRQERLLATADWYSANASGRTIADILRDTVAAHSSQLNRIIALPSEAEKSQFRTAPARLLAAWREAKLPSLKSALDRHLIKDLASIVCDYIVGLPPSDVKKMAASNIDGEQEEKVGHLLAPIAAAANHFAPPVPMELVW